MSNEVRVPKQERAIEKKHRIIQAGFELFSEVGYYSTNTAQIAKRAGVSTGIVYGYFKDKRDILLDVLSLYVDRVFSPLLNTIDNIPALDLHSLASQAIELAICTHEHNAKIHEALHSMCHTDEEVETRFMQLEDEVTLRIAKRFEALGITAPNLVERVHLAIDITQSFAHESVYDHHNYIDYTEFRKIVENTLVSLFE